ncbi:MAG: hypothetical protein IPO33_17190 [Saprospiraceae bacterium]|nr:hypothetical protein [Candidatus Brachybacter algidus]
MVRLFFFFTFIIICLQLSAQRGYEVGGSIGSAWYFGDINNELKLNSPGATIGVASRFNFDERICFKLGINYIMLRGFDSKSDNLYQQARNISFNNHLGEASGQIEVNFLTYRHGSRDDWYTHICLPEDLFSHMLPGQNMMENGKTFGHWALRGSKTGMNIPLQHFLGCMV